MGRCSRPRCRKFTVYTINRRNWCSKECWEKQAKFTGEKFDPRASDKGIIRRE
jgi:hypothetical protein